MHRDQQSVGTRRNRRPRHRPQPTCTSRCNGSDRIARQIASILERGTAFKFERVESSHGLRRWESALAQHYWDFLRQNIFRRHSRILRAFGRHPAIEQHGFVFFRAAASRENSAIARANCSMSECSMQRSIRAGPYSSDHRRPTAPACSRSSVLTSNQLERIWRRAGLNAPPRSICARTS